MEYLTVNGGASAKYEIQRSIFLCNVKGVEDFEEGMSFVKEISKRYSDATHNCYAVITKDGQQKFSDDGEPQGTAGTPILQVLKKNELTNVAAVVTRYFGGIKLGAGGLVASYTKAVVDALANAETARVKLCDHSEITVTYSDYRKVSDGIALYGKAVKTDFSDGIVLTVATPVESTEAFRLKLSELTAGKAQIRKLTQGYVKF